MDRIKAAEHEMPRSPFSDGDFYFKLENYTGARPHYEKVAEDQNCSHEIRGEAWFRLSKTYLNREGHAARLCALEKALQCIPSDPRIYFEFGVLSLETDGVSRAEIFFRKGVELSLEDPEYCEAVGAVLCAAGIHDLAIPYLEMACLKAPSNPNLLQEIVQAYQHVFTVKPSA